MFRAGKKLGKLCKAEGSQNRHYIGVMAEIKVQTLIQGESDGVIVQRSVDLRPGVAKSVVLKAGYDLLDVAYANCSTGRRLEGRATCEINVPRVFKIYPFLVCKEIAKRTVSVGNLTFVSRNTSIAEKEDIPFHRGTMTVQHRYRPRSSRNLRSWTGNDLLHPASRYAPIPSSHCYLQRYDNYWSYYSCRILPMSC